MRRAEKPCASLSPMPYITHPNICHLKPHTSTNINFSVKNNYPLYEFFIPL